MREGSRAKIGLNFYAWPRPADFTVLITSGDKSNGEIQTGREKVW
jgi:hypothetical protein